MPYIPGPWTIEEYGDDDCPSLIIHKDTESRVCFMATPGSHGDPKKIAADAKLIAAAPDLLAALKGLLCHAGIADVASEDKDAEDHALERAARMAITEATFQQIDELPEASLLHRTLVNARGRLEEIQEWLSYWDRHKMVAIGAIHSLEDVAQARSFCPAMQIGVFANVTNLEIWRALNAMLEPRS